MDKRITWAVVGLVLVLATAVGMAKISVLSGSFAACEDVYPGNTVVKTLRLEVTQTGWYHLMVSGGGLSVAPEQEDIYLVANEPKYIPVTIQTPVTLTDTYYTVVFTLTDENGAFVDETTYCIHVTRGATTTGEEVIDFAAGDVEHENGYIVIPLYIRNLGTTPVVVTLDSDYYGTRFTRTSVTVYPGREETVYAKIRAGETVPSMIKFYAFYDGSRKEADVYIGEEDVEPQVLMNLPEKIVLTQDITFVPVRLTNTGPTTIKGKLVGASLPYGVSAYSDEIKLGPKQIAVENLIIRAQGVLLTGDYIGQICFETDNDQRVVCKHVVIELPSIQKKNVEVQTRSGEQVVVFEIENGPKEYTGVHVVTKLPRGWTAQVEPSEFDLGPNETQKITVTLKPTSEAVNGTAQILVETADGKVIASKTIELNKSALTGYALLGGVSPAWVIAAVVILAVLYALFVRKGGSASYEELKEEITRK